MSTLEAYAEEKWQECRKLLENGTQLSASELEGIHKAYVKHIINDLKIYAVDKEPKGLEEFEKLLRQMGFTKIDMENEYGGSAATSIEIVDSKTDNSWINGLEK